MGPGQDSPHQRYELVSTLGRGGFAEVFLGWMNSGGGLRRKVAIKRILPELVQKQSQMFEQMFVDEARLAFQLEHENIVRVYDVGQSANTFFIVMEYVEGMDLKQIYNTHVEQGELMSLEVCLYIGTRVAAGLGYAHSITDDEGRMLGLVHNDISPPNVLIGRNGEVKVADFGLSDARSNSVVTPDGMVKGKFAYISPEGTKDPSLVSYKSDIFSVGVVLWEMIAGRRLFQRSTDIETFKAVRDCEVVDLREVRPEVPPGIADVVHKALAERPEDRHQDCESLCRDLARASYRYGIAFDRYHLRDLVIKIQGGNWTGFSGQHVDGEELKNLLNALDNILPPGVAAQLGDFVTNAKVEEIDEASEGYAFGEAAGAEGWMDDVFSEAGFESNSPASYEDEPAHEAIAVESSASAGAAAGAALGAAAAFSSSPPPSKPGPPAINTPRPSPNAPISSASLPKLPPPVTPTSQSNIPINPASTNPNSGMIRLSATQLSGVSKTTTSGRSASTPSEPAIDPEDLKGAKITFLVWGALIGLLLGVLAGIAIGSLM